MSDTFHSFRWVEMWRRNPTDPNLSNITDIPYLYYVRSDTSDCCHVRIFVPPADQAELMTGSSSAIAMPGAPGSRPQLKVTEWDRRDCWKRRKPQRKGKRKNRVDRSRVRRLRLSAWPELSGRRLDSSADSSVSDANMHRAPRTHQSANRSPNQTQNRPGTI